MSLADKDFVRHVRLTCVAAVMETTKDGTLEQLKFTNRPWKIK